MKNKTRDRNKNKAFLRKLARQCGVPLKTVKRLDRELAAMPMEAFLAAAFAPGEVVYDPTNDLWIARDKNHRGPGLGFIAILRDKSSFRGVIPEEALQ